MQIWPTAKGPSEATDSGQAFRDTLDALAQLGGDVEIELARDLSTALAAAEDERVDLVLVDRAEAEVSEPMLEALAGLGPPVVAPN